jgi:eukaryotic-like serine/threonine-protein kinase
MTFRTGETVGDYEVLGLVGSGGMGRVFRVRNLISDRIEAMKVVLPDAGSDLGIAERFLREIKVHASLEHPNIAAMRTALRVEDRIIMIMEFVEGGSLAAALAEGPLGVQAALSYTGQVLSALAYAHSRGVVHRDIKPANIIVTPDGTAKLTDFGIARAGGSERLTLTGTALGSIYYMSPEQISGSPPDARSDLYSMGVTLYEILTRIHPIEGDNEYAIMNAHLTVEPLPPHEIVRTLPAGLSAVVLRAMAKSPERRFQSAEEFGAELRQFGEFTPNPFPLPATGGKQSATPPRGVLDREQVGRVESHLLRVLGPVARHLVAQAARTAANIEDLCRALGDQIPNAEQRRQFLRSCPEAIRAPHDPSSGTASQPQLAEERLEEASRKLAPILGPVAKVLVNRAARKARTLEELYAMLAAEIPSDGERASFLASLTP